MYINCRFACAYLYYHMLSYLFFMYLCREKELQLSEERSQIKSELLKKVKALEETMNDIVALTNDKAPGDDVEANIINQNLPVSNGKNQMKSLDL